MAPLVPRSSCRCAWAVEPPVWSHWRPRQTSPTRASLWRRPRSAMPRCGSRPRVLFGEIRSIATVEERRRLAREIHDGIAQELASLGYTHRRPHGPRSAGVRRRSRERAAGTPARADPDHQRAAVVDLRSSLRGARRHRPGLGAFRLRPLGRDGFIAHGSPDPRRGAVSTSDRDGDRAHAHRPGGDHQCPPACRSQEPVGDLPRRPATSTALRGRRRRWHPRDDATTASAWRSCANARAGSEPTCPSVTAQVGGTVVEVTVGSGWESAHANSEHNDRKRETRVHDSAVG